MKQKHFLILIFLAAFLVRIWSVWPASTIIGFDQARDLFSATTIFRDHKLHIIGPTAGNNPNLHHGVLFWYYMIPGLILFRGNPIGAVIWNSLFNALAAIVLYFIGRDLFESKKMGIIAAIIASVSYYYIQFSGWLSNPTATFFTLPVFFLGLIEYKKGRNWGLPLAMFFLGVTIQFELFFVYLIPTGIICWIILKPKFPSLKLIIISLLAFVIATFTMILTEIKFHFAGVLSILFAGKLVGGGNSNFLETLFIFISQKWETFYLNLWPQNKDIGTLIGIIAVLYMTFEIIKFRKEKKVFTRNLFILVWFFSPAIMFLLGQYNAPWFYIGRPASAILIASYFISKINSKLLVSFILVLVIFANLAAINDSYGKGQILLEPDASSLMSDQLKAIDYTYQSSNGYDFEINSLTNPLYVNALWGYHYFWYGKSKYGFLPGWVGGDQLYPYGTLPSRTGKEKYLYLLIDTTPRIPPQYRNEILTSADKISKLVEDKYFGGIEVQKREIKVDKLSR